MEKYIVVPLSEIEQYREHKRWEECIFCPTIKGYECLDGAYIVPESLYEEVVKKDAVAGILKHLGETFRIYEEEVVLVGYSNRFSSNDIDTVDCIVGQDSDEGWTHIDAGDIIMDLSYRSYMYVNWKDLNESRSE